MSSSPSTSSSWTGRSATPPTWWSGSPPPPPFLRLRGRGGRRAHRGRRLIADYDGGVASHVRDKFVEMAHLTRPCTPPGSPPPTRATAPRQAVGTRPLAGQRCRRNVTRFPYEMVRPCPGPRRRVVVTLPSEQDLRDPEIGPLLDKYLRGPADVPTEHRVRALRLIENLTLGRNAVGFLTESLHGAGSRRPAWSSGGRWPGFPPRPGTPPGRHPTRGTGLGSGAGEGGPRPSDARAFSKPTAALPSW